jgi:hypothetical protein
MYGEPVCQHPDHMLPFDHSLEKGISTSQTRMPGPAVDASHEREWEPVQRSVDRPAPGQTTPPTPRLTEPVWCNPPASSS